MHAPPKLQCLKQSLPALPREQCTNHKKKVESATRERALKQGEVVW